MRIVSVDEARDNAGPLAAFPDTCMCQRRHLGGQQPSARLRQLGAGQRSVGSSSQLPLLLAAVGEWINTGKCFS